MNDFVNHQLIGRRLVFDFNKTPKHWVPDDVLTTHVLNGMHLLLPAVEHWFCRLANKTLPYVQDENLRADIKGFVLQEAAHANAHKGADIYFAAHNLDPSTFKNGMDWFCKNIVNDTPMGIQWPFNRFKRQWLAYRMGIIACLEHYFCFLGTWALEAQALDLANTDPAMLDLVRWHAAEEVEHRTVAFDAYRALAGDGLAAYLGRQAAMVAAFPTIIVLWFSAIFYLARIDDSTEAKALRQKSVLGLLIEFERHARRTGRLPTLFTFVSGLKDWVKPFHHPEQDGNLDLARAYLANSPAALLAALEHGHGKRH